MSIEENKAIVRRFYEEVRNQKNVDAMDELFGPGFVGHGPSGEIETQDLEQFKQGQIQFIYPQDWHNTIEDMIAEGDKVAIRLTARVTHTSEVWGIPPTGKQVTLHGIDIFRIAGGKIVEMWYNADYLGVVRQLGAVVRPG